MSDSPAPNLERSLYYGVVFMSICYGLEIYMFSHSLYIYLHSHPAVRKKTTFYVLIGALSVSLTTVVLFTDAVFMEFMWIDHRNFEGGPLGYLAANSSIWWQVFGTAANQVTNFLGDGLLIYRCYIIWQANILVIIAPTIVYLGSVAMALVTLYQSAVPDSNFFKGKTVSFGVPWASLSVSVNIIVTTLIVYRLLWSRRQLRHTMTEDMLRMYTGISAILVESALPFSILGIAFAVTYGKNLDVGPAFLFIWATFCALSPQFIIFRVANGTSWTRDIASQATTATPPAFKHDNDTTWSDNEVTESKPSTLGTLLGSNHSKQVVGNELKSVKEDA